MLTVKNNHSSREKCIAKRVAKLISLQGLPRGFRVQKVKSYGGFPIKISYQNIKNTEGTDLFWILQDMPGSHFTITSMYSSDYATKNTNVWLHLRGEKLLFRLCS